ncbi:MAG: type II secretion system F family protein [Anaerolineae bacterium]
MITMDQIEAVLDTLIRMEMLSSPLTFAVLTGLAMAFVWLALAPSSERATAEGRLEGYLRGRDIIEETEMSRSFLRRALIPFFRQILQLLANLTPMRDVARVQRMLMEAGSPAGLTAADIFGLQILAGVAFGGLYVLALRLLGQLATTPTLIAIRNGALLVLIGFLLPRVWLRTKVNQRKHEIMRAFPDALDLLSVSVDAGLALDTAMVRVCERWDNALTEEFNRVVMEIRVGTPRNLALQRMANRTGVDDLQTFVGVLIQSSELGVSIAHTLHTQAAQVRVRRRQRAEELARQASIKMIFVLVFFIFPALLVVLLGPGVPRIFEALGGL